MPLIRAEEITKCFVSSDPNNIEKIRAVDNVSFSVEEGEMFGLVGPDGAGKSTTIKMLCGLHSPDNGRVLYSRVSNKENLPYESDKKLEKMIDFKKNKKNIQNTIGYLSQKFSLYGDLSIDENIEYFAEIHDVRNYENRRNELLEFTRLTKFRNRQADRLSGGMKQKLALACSLIHKPKILFLDEPTTGVDPVSRRDFWNILSDLLKEDITIVMTTPYLDEAERCNRVALMNEGKIISLNTPAKLKESINKTTLEIICNRVLEAAKLIKSCLGIDVHLFGDRLNILIDKSGSEVAEIENVLKREGIKIVSSRRVLPSLENVFIYLLQHKSE